MCTDIDLSDYNLNVTIADYQYSIPFENLLAQTSIMKGKIDCDLYIV